MTVDAYFSVHFFENREKCKCSYHQAGSRIIQQTVQHKCVKVAYLPCMHLDIGGFHASDWWMHLRWGLGLLPNKLAFFAWCCLERTSLLSIITWSVSIIEPLARSRASTCSAGLREAAGRTSQYFLLQNVAISGICQSPKTARMPIAFCVLPTSLFLE